MVGSQKSFQKRIFISPKIQLGKDFIREKSNVNINSSIFLKKVFMGKTARFSGNSPQKNVSIRQITREFCVPSPQSCSDRPFFSLSHTLHLVPPNPAVAFEKLVSRGRTARAGGIGVQTFLGLI